MTAKINRHAHQKIKIRSNLVFIETLTGILFSQLVGFFILKDPLTLNTSSLC
jgi:hypothetical protein